MSSPPIFRFAPSPNGELHLGHAYSALISAQMATEHNGRFLLRIEDIDLARSKPAFEHQIYDDLAWLGLEWEKPVRRQSEHFDDYAQALGKLKAMDVVYPSFASRREIGQAIEGAIPRSDPDGQFLYPLACKQKDRETALQTDGLTKPHSWRLDIDLALKKAQEMGDHPLSFEETGRGPEGQTGMITADPVLWGDVVIARKDMSTSYHLSVVVDDALQGITHVTRGLDLFYASHIHRLLQCLLGLASPLYYHHGLILDECGRRLSKSARDQSLASLRKQGSSPQDIRVMVNLA